MNEIPADSILCRNWTRARRHPFVIGKFGKARSPWPLTPTQLGVLTASAVTLVLTRSMWGRFLPGAIQFLVLVGVPVLLTWKSRALRVDGRAPWRAASSALNYAVRSRQGEVAGRRMRRPRPVRTGGLLFVRP